MAHRYRLQPTALLCLGVQRASPDKLLWAGNLVTQQYSREKNMKRECGYGMFVMGSEVV